MSRIKTGIHFEEQTGEEWLVLHVRATRILAWVHIVFFYWWRWMAPGMLGLTPTTTLRHWHTQWIIWWRSNIGGQTPSRLYKRGELERVRWRG